MLVPLLSQMLTLKQKSLKCRGPDCDFCSGFARSCCGKVKIAFISTYSCLTQHYNQRKVSKFSINTTASRHTILQNKTENVFSASFYNWQFKEVENWIFFSPLWKKKTTSKGCFTNWSSFVVVVGRFEKCIWVEEGREPERQQQRRLTESFYCPLRNFCLLQYSRMLTWSLTRCFFKKRMMDR